MSVRIKVSYETKEELDRVLECLHPVMKSYKVSRSDSGAFRKAYVWVKELEAVRKLGPKQEGSKRKP